MTVNRSGDRESIAYPTPSVGHVSDSFRQDFGQSCVRDAPGSSYVHNVSAHDAHNVAPSVSSSFTPLSLLFPLSDSGFVSRPPSVALSSSSPLSLPLSSSSPASSPLWLLLLPRLLCLSFLSLRWSLRFFLSLPPSLLLPWLPLFRIPILRLLPFFPSRLLPPFLLLLLLLLFLRFRLLLLLRLLFALLRDFLLSLLLLLRLLLLLSLLLSLLLPSSLLCLPLLLSLRGGPPPPGFPSLTSQPFAAAPSSAVSSSSSSSSSLSSSSSSSVSSPVGDLAEFQARVLGLSAEYQALGRWFVASGGSDFRSYVASYCPHLYSDFRADFASGSSRFLAALASAASLSLPSSAAPPSVSSSAPSSLPPVAPLPLSSSSSSSVVPPPPPPAFSHASLPSASEVSWPGFAAPAGSAVALVVSAASVSLSDPFTSFCSFFVSSFLCGSWAFSAGSVCPLFSLPSTPAAPVLAPASSSSFASADPVSFSAPSSSSFVAPDELPMGAAPDALPPDDDSAVLDSVCSEFRRMVAFLVDLFPQAAGSHSSLPPPWALFEDFFGSAAPHSPPIFLSWFERVRIALSEADSRLSSFLSSGRSDFSFLPPRNSSFVSGQAVPVNHSLLSLYEKQLKPSHHVGLTVRKAAALESSLRCHAEALSHSMWVLSGLLGFVRLQNFAPSDVTL